MNVHELISNGFLWLRTPRLAGRKAPLGCSRVTDALARGSVPAVLACGVLALGASSAYAAVEHKYMSSITQTGPFEPFATPWGLAFDGSGDLLMADSEHGVADVFGPENEYKAQFGPGFLTQKWARSIAVDHSTGYVYVTDIELSEDGSNVVVFKPKGTLPEEGYEHVATWTGALSKGSFGPKIFRVMYVAVDNSAGPRKGDLYVMSMSENYNVVSVFKPDAEGGEGEFVEELKAPPGGWEFSRVNYGGPGEKAQDGLTVDPATGNVYVVNYAHGDEINNGIQEARKGVFVFNDEGVEQPWFAPRDAQLPGGSFGGPTAVAVDPSNGEVFVLDGADNVVDEFSKDGEFLGAIKGTGSGTPFSGPLGVAVSAAHDVYVSDGAAVDEFGPDQDEPLAPRVGNEVASGVGLSDATLHADINPQGLGASFDTHYRFEYGTSTAYGTSIPAPEGSIGASRDNVAVSQRATGLSANTTYHWRVVARNANGTTTGLDHTFVYGTSGGGLPDNRAYEMVTPAHKNGALVGEKVFGLGPDISLGGSRVTLATLQCFPGATSCTVARGITGVDYSFTRTSEGWTPRLLNPPATQFEASTVLQLSAEEGTTLLSMPTPPYYEDDLYAERADGSLTRIGPLTPPSAGRQGLKVDGNRLATGDLSHVVWEQQSGSDWSSLGAGNRKVVFEYVGSNNSQPTLVGVSGGLGSTDLISSCGTYVGGPGNLSDVDALSADGHIVYFTAEACASGSGANVGVEVPAATLYARIDQSETVAISKPSPLDCTSVACLGSQASAAAFQGASSDGSKAFFSSTQQLTDSASGDPEPGDTAGGGSGCANTIGANGCNLYEYDFANPAGHNLIAVSAGDSSGTGPRVQGVCAVSPDGSHVYFVAKGVLSTTPNSAGQSARAGGENLYVFERDATHPGGHTAFIATLSSANVGKEDTDSENWIELEKRQANVTPDGRYLVFTSMTPLTPDDTRPEELGSKQVYRYDAQTAALVRISIGEQGFNDNGNHGTGDAGIVPGSSLATFFAGGLTRWNPTMSNDGSYVFFTSQIGLTPKAFNEVLIEGVNVNGNGPVYAQNVYEYHDGHVYLISDGKDTGKVAFRSATQLVGTDASGANVFFTTASQLVPQDKDTQLDYYDARVCTAGDPCIALPPPALAPCLGESCHGTPAGTPLLPSAPSATFNGAGNFTAPLFGPVVSSKAKRCKPHFVRKRGRCVKAKRARRAKRSSTASKGRAGR